MKIEGDIEEMAEESAQDRRDHAELTAELEWLMKHEGAMKVPVATRRLVDDGVDPLVIAKVMLVGDRDGGTLYTLSARAHLQAMGAHEKVASRMLAIAITDVAVEAALQMLAAGAVWLATQFGLDRPMLASLVRAADRRVVSIVTVATLSPAPVGYGAIDLVDLYGVKDRAWLVEAVEQAQLPLYAPLEYKPS